MKRLRKIGRGMRVLGWVLAGSACLASAETVLAQEARETEEMRELRRQLAETRRALADLRREMAREMAAMGEDGAWSVRWSDGRQRIGVVLDSDADRELSGAKVIGVSEGGPADEAGIRRDDLITHFGGRDLTRPLESEEDRLRPRERLARLIESWEGEAPAEVRVTRDGEELTLEVTPSKEFSTGFSEMGEAFREIMESIPDMTAPALELSREAERLSRELAEEYRDLSREWAQQYQSAPRSSWRGSESRSPWYFSGGRRAWRAGIEAITVNSSLGAYFGVDAGVLIAEVDEESGMGLEVGDVVVAVGGRDIEDVADFDRVLSSYRPNEEIELTVYRGGGERTVTGVAPGSSSSWSWRARGRDQVPSRRQQR